MSQGLPKTLVSWRPGWHLAEGDWLKALACGSLEIRQVCPPVGQADGAWRAALDFTVTHEWTSL